MTHDEIQKLFDSEQGWTTQFRIDGRTYGGNTSVLTHDPRLLWHIEQAGGLKGKTVLELGPLEGGHTKTMLDAGARRVTAVEGNADCYRRCLIVAQVLDFDPFRHEFRKADFTVSIPAKAAEGKYYDVISAAGVLCHQLNPAKLIFDMARITDTVFVWSHVAGKEKPTGENTLVFADEYRRYGGRYNNYGNARTTAFCAGLNEKAVWLYPDEMLKCFDDAGFKNVTVKEHGEHPNGDYILFIAKKKIRCSK